MHPYQKWLNRLILVLTGIRRLPRHRSVFGTRFWFREAKKLRGPPAIPCLGRENSQLRLQQPGKSFPNTLFNLNIYLSIKMVGDGYLLRFFLLVSIFLVGKLLSGLFFFFFSYPGQCFFLFTFFLIEMFRFAETESNIGTIFMGQLLLSGSGIYTGKDYAEKYSY